MNPGEIQPLHGLIKHGEFWVIRVDGTSTLYKNPTVIRLHNAIGGCPDPEIVILDGTNNIVMIVDHSAKANGKRLNSKATVLYYSRVRTISWVQLPDMLDRIHGDAAVVYFEEIA